MAYAVAPDNSSAYCGGLAAEVDSVVVFYVHTNITNVGTGFYSFAEVTKPIRNAAQTWTEEARLNKRFLYAGSTSASVSVTDTTNTVSWTNSTTICGGGAFSCTVLNAGWVIDGADIFLLDQGATHDWEFHPLLPSTTSPYDVDIQAQLTHEFGHMLGFADSVSCGDTARSVMQPPASTSTASKVENRFLKREDFVMAYNFYGTPITTKHNSESSNHGVAWATGAPSLPSLETYQRFGFPTNWSAYATGIVWTNELKQVMFSKRIGTGAFSAPVHAADVSDDAFDVWYQAGVASDNTGLNFVVAKGWRDSSVVKEGYTSWRLTTDGGATWDFQCGIGLSGCVFTDNLNQSATYDPIRGYYIIVSHTAGLGLYFHTVTTAGVGVNQTSFAGTSMDIGTAACSSDTSLSHNCVLVFGDSGFTSRTNNLKTYPFRVRADGVLEFASGVVQAIPMWEPPSITYDPSDSGYPFKLVYTDLSLNHVVMKKGASPTATWSSVGTVTATKPSRSPVLGLGQYAGTGGQVFDELNVYHVQRQD